MIQPAKLFAKAVKKQNTQTAVKAAEAKDTESKAQTENAAETAKPACRPIKRRPPKTVL